MLEIALGMMAMALADPVMAEPKRDPARWVRARDLPTIERDAAVTTFDLTIDMVGEPIRCSIVVASGSEALDAAVCDAMMRRARFSAAEDGEGNPIYAVYRDRVLWQPTAIGDPYSFDDADIVVFSADARDPDAALTEVHLRQNNKGAVVDCRVISSSGSVDLDQLACFVASQSEVSPPIIKESGEPVAGIRSFLVAFVSGNETRVVIR